MSDEAAKDDAPEPGSRAAQIAARDYYPTLDAALTRHVEWPGRTARWASSDRTEVDHMLAALTAEYGEGALQFYVAPTNVEIAIATESRKVGAVCPGFIWCRLQWDRPRVIRENGEGWMKLSCFSDNVDGDSSKVQVARCVFCADVLDEEENCRSGCAP